MSHLSILHRMTVHSSQCQFPKNLVCWHVNLQINSLTLSNHSLNIRFGQNLSTGSHDILYVHVEPSSELQNEMKVTISNHLLSLLS